MTKNLLAVIPHSRINDCFVNPNSALNFSPVLNSYKDQIIQGRPHLGGSNFADFYEQIGIDIVVETAMNYPYPFITEKIYRPIASGRPFIVLGPFRTLAFLKSLNFLTFPSIIDEKYDDIADPEARFIEVCRVIKDFVNRPLDCVVEDVQSVKQVLVHNQKRLSDLLEDQIQDIKKQLSYDNC